MDQNFRKTASYLVSIFGILLCLSYLASLFVSLPNAQKVPIAVFWAGLALVAAPLLLVSGLNKIKFKDAEVSFGPIDLPPPKQLDPVVEQKRIQIAQRKGPDLPGSQAQDFQLLDEKLLMMVTPRADQMTPMYLLDKEFRIIDWNIAFNLCFDRTIEGRRGTNVLEWTYFLDNYEEVLDHGIKVFGKGGTPPLIDIEELEYTSHTYGKLTGTKRAYQIPGDDGLCQGWLITIIPKFLQEGKWLEFQGDLFAALQQSLMWSQYALCYDKVLNNCQIYPELLNTLLGNQKPGPYPLPPNTTVLDLGAGTGNLSWLLAKSNTGHLVVSLENNPVMLGLLRQKCQAYLREDALGPGIVAVKQDIGSLNGLNDEFFDFVLINNVLYCLEPEDMKSCLREVYRVLKPGGELRFSEPQKTTRVDKVLEQIGKDLKLNGLYDKYEADYLKVREINTSHLSPMLERWAKNGWTLDEMKNLLTGEIGCSEVVYSADDVYAGQSMLACVRK